MLDPAVVAWTLFGADFLLRLLLAVRVVMRAVPVPVALSWLVVILLVPGLGIPLYILIGEVRLGSRRIRRYREVAKGLEERAHVFWNSQAERWTSDVEPYKHIARLLSNVGEMPPLLGNELSMLPDSLSFIRSLVQDINASERWCHLVYYIWADDDSGLAVGTALMEAAKRGVECRLLVDAAGSKKFLRSELAARMRAAGVRIAPALPVSLLRAAFQRVDIRNHRKIAVIDGWAAHTGSHNVVDPGYGHNPRSGIGPWIDASVRIAGPAAQSLEVVFLRDWHMERDEPLPPIEDLLPVRPVKGGSIVQVVPSGPVPNPDAMQEALLTAVYSARREILMTTPYFVPDEGMRMALICAARQGVAVTLVVPRKLDQRIVAAASRASLQDLLDAGVRVLEFRPGLLHAKTVTIDSDVALIGSTNLDIRSMRLNFEITLFVFDSDFASQVRMLQTQYISHAEELFAAEWRRRPVWERFKEGVARLASPLL